MEEFIKTGFPAIKLLSDHFEIKSIDTSNYRSFNYSEVSKVEYYKESDKGNWWFMPWVQTISSKSDKFKLKIIKQNGGDWKYETHSKESDNDFEAIINELKNRCDSNLK